MGQDLRRVRTLRVNTTNTKIMKLAKQQESQIFSITMDGTHFELKKSLSCDNS